jgi:hypothetical protein
MKSITSDDHQQKLREQAAATSVSASVMSRASA